MKVLIGTEMELNLIIYNAKKEVFDDLEKSNSKWHGIQVGSGEYESVKQKHLGSASIEEAKK